jgi:uncharacterized coiled-coil protein SlyX
MKICLFGVNKIQVDYELEKIEKEYELKLHERKHDIEKLRMENQELLKQLESLKNQRKNYVGTIDFVEFSLKKAEEYSPLLKDAAYSEVERLITIGENTEKVLNERITEFNQEIKQTQGNLDLLLKNVLNENESIGEKLKQFRQQESNYIFTKSKETENNLKYKSNQSKFNNSKEDMTINKSNFSENLTNTLEEKESSDFKNIFDKAFYSEIEKSNIKHFEVKSIEEDLGHCSFWEEEENDVNKKDSEKSKPVDNVKIEEIDTKSLDEAESVKSSISDNRESKAIASDITNLRIKYLLGKITGTDLVDKNGNVIICRNSIITNEIVDRAEKEGKLAELIVNMTIPGL